jgi:methionine aminopeptidase
MNKVVADFNCNMVEGVLSHIVKKYCIDGNKAIISKEGPAMNVEEWTFAPGEVIHLDVYVSTGEGKPKLSEHRTTVYKRELQNMYNLKIQKSRAFFAESNKRFPSLPYSLRAFEDQIGAKVGVKECVDHELIQEFPVLVEKEGEFVAHFKSTVAVLPRSTAVLAGNHAVDAAKVVAAAKSEEVKAFVAKELWVKDREAKK